MEDLKKIALPAAAAFILLLILFLCKSSPVSKLWKGYTTLSVPVGADQKLVNDVLRERECGLYISLEGQPEEFSFDGYQEKKFRYFFDRENSARIYYIPDSRAKEASMAARILQSRHHIDASLGNRAAFPYLGAFVCLFALLALLRFAQNKAVFFAAAFPGLFYAFCNPFYAAAAAVCLELYALYLGQRLWRRRGAAAALAGNRIALIFFAAALPLSFTAGLLRSVFFLLNVFCSVCLLFLFFNLQKRREKSERFLPVLIRSAQAVNAVGIKTIKKAFFVSAEAFVLFVFLCGGTDFLSSGGKRGLFFPAPTEYNKGDSRFLTLEDYFASRWNKAVFPYRPVNKEFPSTPKEGETVEMTHYLKKDGAIQSKSETLFAYDKAFKKEAAAALEKSESPLLEKLLYAQGEKKSAAYVSGGSEACGFAGAAALLFAALLPLLCALALRLKIKGRI